jgi:hypothetical protein
MKKGNMNDRSVINAPTVTFQISNGIQRQTLFKTSQENLLTNDDGGLDDGFLDKEWWDKFNADDEETTDPNQLLQEYVPLGSNIPGEEGQNSKEWHDAKGLLRVKKDVQ